MFVLLLTLCSFASCNGYVIATDDSWTDKAPCMVELVSESDRFANVWGHSMPGMQKYLDRFDVQEGIQTLVDYDHTCEWVAQRDVP